MTDTAPVPKTTRSNSITEYSQIFSQNTLRPGTFINQKRHPSLSMRHDRTTSFSKLGVNVMNLTNNGNESAIDDTTDVANSPAAEAPRSKTDDPVGLGRRLSQGARAIMYNGNRMRGDSVSNNSGERGTAPARTFSQSSTVSTVSNPQADNGPSSAGADISARNNLDLGKQIKRRMSPTGERMLRGELAFH